MYTTTALEARLLQLINSQQALTLQEAATNFECAEQAQKAVEGCLSKQFIALDSKTGKYSLTKNGKQQI